MSEYQLWTHNHNPKVKYWDRVDGEDGLDADSDKVEILSPRNAAFETLLLPPEASTPSGRMFRAGFLLNYHRGILSEEEIRAAYKKEREIPEESKC